MTRSTKKESINLDETIRHALAEGQRLLRERTLRELRYHPNYSGDITVTLRIRDGVPFAAKENTEQNLLIPAVGR